MLSAAILAGGRARRFDGRDKSQLVVDGRPLIARQVEAIAPLAAEILLVGRAPGAASPPEVRVLPDRLPAHGPLGGLDTALAVAAGDPTLVVACDMPFLSTALLRRLAELAEDADAAMPRTDRGYHPLCAAYRRRCLVIVARHLAEGRLRMLDLVDDLRVRTLDRAALAAYGDPNRLLANINTAADYRTIEAHQHGERSS